MKKNLTLSIDEDLLDKSRVLAAMRRTSVNDMVRQFLRRETGLEGQAAHNAEWQSFFKKVDSRATEAQRVMPAGLPSKADLNDENMRERGLL